MEKSVPLIVTREDIHVLLKKHPYGCIAEIIRPTEK